MPSITTETRCCDLLMLTRRSACAGAVQTSGKASSEPSSAKAAGAKVVLLGMQVPPNYGQDYNRQFSSAFSKVAKDQKIALVPFFLRGVADAPNAASLFQADRIHPLAQAHPTLLSNVWPTLRKLLSK